MSGHKGTPVCAATRGPVSAAADTPPPLHCPRAWLGCQAMFWPPVGSATRSNRRCALPPRSAPRGAHGRHRRRCALPVPRIPATPNPLQGALRIADRSWRSAAVPLLPLILCGRSSLLASVCTVMPQGACVKAWPRCAHPQDGHRGPTASEGTQACQAGLARARRGGGAEHGGGRSAGVGGRTVWGQRAPTPLVRRCAPRVGRAVFYSPGCVPADRDAVEGFPWPGRPRGWAPLGGRSPGLPLAAAVLPA